MKRLNHFQAHPNKKRKKLPPRIPTKEQLRLIAKAFDEMSKLAKQVGFIFNQPLKLKL